MKIVIACGTGFLGRRLASSLVADGHRLVVLTRRGGGAPANRIASTDASHAMPTAVAWHPTGEVGDWASQLDDAEAVVNLAVEPIAARRWTPARKQRILDSRVQATRSLAATLTRTTAHAVVFVSGSA